MDIQQSFLTNNDCYKAGRTISPAGIVVHDTATNQRKVSVYLSSWNKSGVEKCVHAFIGTRPDGSFGVVQTLPWDRRCWGCSRNILRDPMTFPTYILKADCGTPTNRRPTP